MARARILMLAAMAIATMPQSAAALEGAQSAVTDATAVENDMNTAPTDFSKILNKADVERLVESGELVPVHLFPIEFGGPEVAQNIVHVTPRAAEDRQRIIATLTGDIEEGKFDQMDVLPEYKGKSLVPSTITMKASSARNDLTFEPVIRVW